MNPIDYWYQKYVALKAEVDRSKAREVATVEKDVYLEWGRERIDIYDKDMPGLKFGDRVRITISRVD